MFIREIPANTKLTKKSMYISYTDRTFLYVSNIIAMKKYKGK